MKLGLTVKDFNIRLFIFDNENLNYKFHNFVEVELNALLTCKYKSVFFSCRFKCQVPNLFFILEIWTMVN